MYIYIYIYIEIKKKKNMYICYVKDFIYLTKLFKKFSNMYNTTCMYIYIIFSFSISSH